MIQKDSERGAAAVEFAILLPVLLLVLIGIMEFGRAYNVQITASNAAREGARYAAVHYADTSGFTLGKAITVVRNAAPTLPVSTAINVTYSAGSSCGEGKTVKVTVLPPRKWLTGFLPFPAPQISAVGVMQCGG